MYGISQYFFPNNQQMPGTSQINPIQTQKHSVSIHGNYLIKMYRVVKELIEIMLQHVILFQEFGQ